MRDELLSPLVKRNKEVKKRKKRETKPKQMRKEKPEKKVMHEIPMRPSLLLPVV